MTKKRLVAKERQKVLGARAGLTWQEAIMDAKAGRRGVDTNEPHLLKLGHPVVEEGCLVLHVHLQQENPLLSPLSYILPVQMMQDHIVGIRLGNIVISAPWAPHGFQMMF